MFPIVARQAGPVSSPSLAGPIGTCSMQAAVRGLSMEKRLCWASLAVAGLMLLLFLPDLIFKFPFGQGISRSVDIVVVISAVILGYLSWNALRDLR
jgi:hypothetical protein